MRIDNFFPIWSIEANSHRTSLSEHTASPKAPLKRRILGSALSALVGWLALNVFVVGVLALEALLRAQPSTNVWWLGAAFIAPYSAVFVFATWLVLFLPLYLLVPSHSAFWWWPICTLCGAIAGALMMFGFYGPNSPDSHSTSMIVLAAATGAVTCLFGALTARRFHHV